MGFQNGWRGPDIVSDGLVLYLDAGSPNSYRPDFGTTWRDMSGFNNSGSLVNGPTYSSANGGSIVFDGVDDFASTPQTIEAATSSNLQTFCGWLFGVSNNNSFFGSNAGSAGQFHLILNFQSNGQLRFAQSTYGGGPVSDQNNIVTVTSNSTWNYGCIVKTAASTFDVYFNGNVVITGATKTANLSSSFNIGRWWSGQNVPSTVSSIQIYNRALSATEIQQNYNAQKSRFGL